MSPYPHLLVFLLTLAGAVADAADGVATSASLVVKSICVRPFKATRVWVVRRQRDACMLACLFACLRTTWRCSATVARLAVLLRLQIDLLGNGAITRCFGVNEPG
jgi:hypothetical protein